MPRKRTSRVRWSKPQPRRQSKETGYRSWRKRWRRLSRLRRGGRPSGGTSRTSSRRTLRW
eukprot:jgi/Chlat1/7676/Chrsp64S07142